MTDAIDALLASATGFDWDAGNAPKVQARHQVDPGECEQAFFVDPFIVAADATHSQREARWYALGRTFANRYLYLVFTMRGSLIRVISARPMNRKERRVYVQTQAREEGDPAR